MKIIFISNTRSIEFTGLGSLLRKERHSLEFMHINEWSQTLKKPIIVDSDALAKSPNAYHKVKTHNKSKLLFCNTLNNRAFYFIERMDFHGLVQSHDTTDEILKSISEVVVDNHVYFKPDVMKFLISNKLLEQFNSIDKLTERELEVIQLICHNHSNESIANKLKLSIRTVNAHKFNIQKKLDLDNPNGLFYIVSQYFPNYFSMRG